MKHTKGEDGVNTHTKGVWRMTDERQGMINVFTDRAFIANVRGLANANLIASAPKLNKENEELKVLNAELLGACKSLVISYEYHCPGAQDKPDAIVFARKAITKAEGKK